MTTVLQKASVVLHDSLSLSTGVNIVYARGSDSAKLVAIPGSSEHEEYTEEEYPITAESHDWVFKVSMLRLPVAGLTTPQAGDTVTHDGAEYRVMPIAGDRCYKFTDQTKLVYRVHSQQVS